MQRKLVLGLATLGFMIAVACSGQTVGSEDAGPTGTLPCDVDAVLAQNCRTCHGATPQFGAPMPLVTLADLHADAKLTPGKKVYETVAARIHDDAKPMPQPPNPRLSAGEAATLDAWIASGAQGATAAACDAGPPGFAIGKLPCAADQKIRPSSKFAMTGDDPDRYICYGFDTDVSMKRHVIAGAPHVDNASIVHHILLYQSPNKVDSNPVRCAANGGPGWRLVTGWSPGGGVFELPPEAGFPEETGTTHWALQIHYNNTQGLVDQVDGSGYDLCTTDALRPHDADILATGTLMIAIPPRSTTETTCEMQFPEKYGKINVISSWAHMHRLGRAEYAKRIRNGSEATLLDSPAFDYDLGGAAGPVNVDVQPGDTLRTMCRWKNTGDETVRFGGGTESEMCFAFLTYWPKIADPQFAWIVPASPDVSQCTTTTTP
ncbi:MAG TPA: peptidylglycine alpha-amidating monooxygenase [Labilithrix sp.]|nr:peptidylglycine alpha-amidating monooxygenase [Labilithrix sp.]